MNKLKEADMQLKDWLEKIQLRHPKEIDLGLERVAEVVKRLQIMPNCPVITVAGTNGKGSCVAGLETIYLEAGFRVGAFTSPILFRHNEYIRIQKNDVDDETLCRAFEKVEQSLSTDLTLTPFEFNTLAAFVIFQEKKLDVWLLEVGLGGRWDAVNAIDADLAIVSSIGIDHIEWLGDTREKIAIEKAGIFRSGKPAVCGDFNPPATLLEEAKKIGINLFCQNQEFGFSKNSLSWNWRSDKKQFENLPLTHLALQNMSTVLMAIELLQNKLEVKQTTIEQALKKINLPGRIQIVPGEISQVFDVSHNPASAEMLSHWLNENSIKGKTRAVFSMLADKDILGTIDVIKEHIDEWHLAPLSGSRAASIDLIKQNFEKAQVKNIKTFSKVIEAYQVAMKNSQPNDRVVVFGSFHTVSDVLKECQLA